MSQNSEDPSHRLNTFKYKAKNTDEMRRRRNEVSVQLRKDRRTDQLQKRRNISLGAQDDAPASQNDTLFNSDLTPDDIINDIISDNTGLRFMAVQSARKLLSRERCPPIDKMIKAGLVPLLVKCLDEFEYVNLQFEAAWALTNIASGTSEQTAAVVEAGAVPKLVSLLGSPHSHIVEQAVWAIGNIAGDGPVPRDLILNLNVTQHIIRLITPDLPVAFLRNVVWTISNLCRNKNPPPNFDLVAPCLPYLNRLLDYEDNDVLADCCWALSYLTDGSNDKIQHIIDYHVVPKLLKLLGKGVHSVTTPALRVIGNIVTGNDEQTDEVLKHGGLVQLAQLLSSPRNNIVKETAWAISNVTAGNKNQIQMVIDAGIIPLLVSVLRKGDFKSQREAAWAITNFTSGCTLQQLSHLMNVGILAPFCQVLDSKDWKTVSVVLDGILNIFQATEKISEHINFALLVEECGGLDKLEALQTHENETIYNKTLHIIDTYFSEEDDPTGVADSVTENGQLTFNVPDQSSTEFCLN